MKKVQQVSIGLAMIFIQLIPNKAICQCNWRSQLSDGFEYTTACPYVISGTVYTNIPQTYSVHSGMRSLYLNFVDCAGGQEPVQVIPYLTE